MDGAFDLHAFRGLSAPGGRIVGAVHRDHLAIGIRIESGAGDNVAIAQSHHPSRPETMKFFRRVWHKVVLFDVQLTTEGDLPLAKLRAFWMIGGRQPFLGVFRIVVDDQFKRRHHRHASRGVVIEHLTHGVFEEFEVDHRILLGYPDPLGEQAQCRRGIAASAHSLECWHPRIVPPAYLAGFDQREQLAFAGERVGEFQPCKLVLVRARGDLAVGHAPIVERAMVLKLQRAYRMRDALECIGQGMGEVVHRVDGPGIACAVMMMAPDSVEHRIAHVDVRGTHVDASAQYMAAVCEFAVTHALKQLQGLLSRSVAIG